MKISFRHQIRLIGDEIQIASPIVKPFGDEITSSLNSSPNIYIQSFVRDCLTFDPFSPPNVNVLIAKFSLLSQGCLGQWHRCLGEHLSFDLLLQYPILLPDSLLRDIYRPPKIHVLQILYIISPFVTLPTTLAFSIRNSWMRLSMLFLHGTGPSTSIGFSHYTLALTIHTWNLEQ
jgi:hypothetical protein